MFLSVIKWFEYSRWYALPMSFFSWLIIFSFGYINNGNVLYGLIALVGILFGHLATNLFDDFFDFQNLNRYTDYNNKVILPNTQRGKCAYLTERKVSLKDVITVVGVYCLIAFLIGCFFYYIYGKTVLLYMAIGCGIIFLYPFLSNYCLSELLVGLAFGPLLFSGTYFVMTGKLGLEPVILSIPSMIFTINLLYTDMFLDKDIDKKEGKKTLVNLLGNRALSFHRGIMTMGYISVLLVPVFDLSNWQIFSVFCTIPLAIDLSESLELYRENSSSVPEKKWYHFPFEAWSDIKENRSMPFMFRMYQARNLMIYTSILLALSVYFFGV